MANNEYKDFWKTQLSAFDAELVKMVESLTEKPCEPKNGGNHYFFRSRLRKAQRPGIYFGYLGRKE